MTVVSTVKSKPPMIADELRRQADLFLELADLRPEIERQPGQSQTIPVHPMDEDDDGDDLLDDDDIISVAEHGDYRETA